MNKEDIGNKYGLIPSSFKTGSKAMKCLGSWGGSSIKFTTSVVSGAYMSLYHIDGIQGLISSATGRAMQSRNT